MCGYKLEQNKSRILLCLAIFSLLLITGKRLDKKWPTMDWFNGDFFDGFPRVWPLPWERRQVTPLHVWKYAQQINLATWKCATWPFQLQIIPENVKWILGELCLKPRVRRCQNVRVWMLKVQCLEFAHVWNSVAVMTYVSKIIQNGRRGIKSEFNHTNIG